MYKLIVTSVTKEHSQVDNQDLLAVEVSFIDTETNQAVNSAKYGFSYNLTKEELQIELQKILATFNSDAQLAKQNAAKDAMDANAQDLIDSFQGKEVVLEDQINSQEVVDTTPNTDPVVTVGTGETNA